MKGRSAAIEGGLSLASGLSAAALAVNALGVGLGDWSLPWGEGDYLPAYAWAENLERGHWYLNNPDLGFPAFQDHGHWPVVDIVTIAQWAVLSRLTGDSISAVNIFGIATFFTVAATSYLVFRFLGVARTHSVVVSVAFSVLPWHFSRAAGHLTLASYLSVPLALLLVDAVARRRLEKFPSRGLMGVCLVAGLMVGLNGVYYALMASFLLLAVLVVDALRTGPRIPGWRSLVVSGSVPLGTAIAVAVNRISISTSSTADSVVRSPHESLLYGGVPATLFFPDSRTTSGDVLNGVLDLAIPGVGGEGDAMLSSAGVAAVALTCTVMLARWCSNGPVLPTSTLGMAAFWPGMFLLVGAFYVSGGFGALFSYWISADIRAWGRYAVFLVGIAFLVMGLVSTGWSRSANRYLRGASTALMVGVAILVIVDLRGAGFTRDPSAAKARDLELTQYVDALEASLPDRCPILQWPLVAYPEVGPTNGMADYSHFWTYLYSEDLRWSYGAMKGTAAADWGQGVRDDLPRLWAAASAAGFCGVQVDTAAFAAPEEIEGFAESLGTADLASSSGRWVYFDLPGAAEAP